MHDSPIPFLPGTATRPFGHGRQRRWPAGVSLRRGLLYGALAGGAPRLGHCQLDVAGMSVKVSRTDKGWRAHRLMPWKGQGAERPKPGNVWGLNLLRMKLPRTKD